MKQTTLICDYQIKKVHLSQATILGPAQILGFWQNSAVHVYLYSFPNLTTILSSILQDFSQGIEDSKSDCKHGQLNPEDTEENKTVRDLVGSV